MKNRLLLLAPLLLLDASASLAQVTMQLESGLVFSGYNDVQVPGDTGTRFSLSRDLNVDPAAYARAQIEWRMNERSSLLLLLAPLRLRASGTVSSDLSFAGTTFPADTPLSATYDFNSYRLTWRRDFGPWGGLRAALGLTAKIRDAAIRIGGGGLSSGKTNVGFVPLLHFLGAVKLGERAEILITGDALAAPQGRAEDVLVAFTFPKWNGPIDRLIGEAVSIDVFVGYRVVEGGADVEEVYNFALIHYAAAGLRITF